jgi:hypothetical protein
MKAKKVTLDGRTFNSIKQALAYYNIPYSLYISRRHKGYSLEEAIKFPKKEKIKLDLSEDDFIHKMSVQFSVDEGYVWNIMHIKHVPRGLVEQYLIVDRRLTNYKDQLKDLKNKYEETQEKYYSTKSLLFSFVKDK